MNYTVDWEERADDELAAVWLAADDRAAVTRATRDLERLLARTPLAVGESRQSSVQRVCCVPPVGMEYEVIEDDKRVIVQAVFAVKE